MTTGIIKLICHLQTPEIHLSGILWTGAMKKLLDASDSIAYMSDYSSHYEVAILFGHFCFPEGVVFIIIFSTAKYKLLS